MLAWLGPAIGPKHFEVGDDVRAAFVDDGRRKPRSAFARNARGRWQCDLYALARQRLAALGVTQMSRRRLVHLRRRDRFFSYRRDGRCGRMAALDLASTAA